MTESGASPTRSWLFTLATRPDRFEKAAAVGAAADVVMIDLDDAVAPSEMDTNGSIMTGTPGHSGTVVAGVREAAPGTPAPVRARGRENPGRVHHDSPGHLVQQSLCTAAEIESPTPKNKSFRALQAGARADPDAVRLLQQTLLRRSDRFVKENHQGR
jgi:hypothetical protein